MAIEIEVKAYVKDAAALRGKLDAYARFKFEYDKQDDYWFPAPGSGAAKNLPVSGARVRQETTRANETSRAFTLVTYKTKELRNAIEVNTEREFIVAPNAQNNNAQARQNFENLLQLLGMRVGYSKRKRGVSYRAGRITAELSLVERLGWFIELEILTKDADTDTVATARAELLAFLGDIGVDESDIEPRYYSELLAALPNGGA
jgi:adenylate cyclase class 2